MTEKKTHPKKSAKNQSANKNKRNKRDAYPDPENKITKYYNNDENAAERGDEPMTIVGHLNEMRSRLIVSLASITIITLAAFFFFSDFILEIINKPYGNTGLKLSVFSLSEGFILKAKASLVTGIFTGLPIIVFEIWKYISPAIDKQNRRFIRMSVIAAVFLMYSGILLTYFFLLPIGIKTLLSFTPESMNSIIGGSNYLNFVFLFCLAMGIMCELPILILILTKIGLISPEILIRKRKYAIVLIWIFAAILTPGPDILSQALVAIPIMLLYEISIIISKVIAKRKAKQEL